MIALARAELLKLRSTRTALGLFIVIVVVTLVPAVAHHDPGAPRRTCSGRRHDGRRRQPHAGPASSLLVFGILGMTNEYRHGTITYTYLVTPRRWHGDGREARLLRRRGHRGDGRHRASGRASSSRSVAALRDIAVPWLATSGVSDARDDSATCQFRGRRAHHHLRRGLGALFRAQVLTVAGVLIWALASRASSSWSSRRVGIYLPFTVFQQLTLGGSLRVEDSAGLPHAHPARVVPGQPRLHRRRAASRPSSSRCAAT